jgi:hypothetical protein
MKVVGSPELISAQRKVAGLLKLEYGQTDKQLKIKDLSDVQRFVKDGEALRCSN